MKRDALSELRAIYNRDLSENLPNTLADALCLLGDAAASKPERGEQSAGGGTEQNERKRGGFR